MDLAGSTKSATSFQTLLGLGSQQAPTTYDEIIAMGPAAAERTAELTG